MDSPLYEAVVVPVGLGEVSSFNRAIFPLSSYRKRDSLGRSDLYLDATLDEMLKITKIGTNPEQWKGVVNITKRRYDRLMLRKAELEQRPKTKNPLKMFANYRAAQLFLAASKSLYIATKGKSEEMMRTVGRSLLSVPGEDVQAADNNVPPDASISGIAVRLDRPLDDTMKQQILDAANTIASFSGPFGDDGEVSDTSSFLTDDYILASESLVSSNTEEAADDTISPLPPSSPITIQNHYTFYGSVYAPNSIVSGATVQIDGENNSGSVTHTITPSNTI